MGEVSLSVFMITYNHEMFIKQAIEGVLMQKVNFPLELVIGEDCSTDSTRKICEDFAYQYPGTIKLLPSEGNLGMMANSKRTLQACNGKYIALCEGDDYWTDPNKLQKQVDFLESNNDFSLCFHRAMLLEGGNFELHPIPELSKEKIEYIDLLSTYNFITTASVVFRNRRFDLTRHFCNNLIGDFNLYFTISRYGKFKCIEEVMSVYRVHDGGVWSGTSMIKQKENYLSFCKAIDQYLDPDEKLVVSANIRRTTKEICSLKYSNKLIRTIMVFIKLLK